MTDSAVKKTIDPDLPDWGKGGGLLPAIVQDAATRRVLMLGYMDRAALEKTQAGGLVTFFSRSKQRLWTKGESSGNVLKLVGVRLDCDRDTILVSALPAGPACHRGTESCFDDETGESCGEESCSDPLLFLNRLAAIIRDRAAQVKENGDAAAEEKSYTARLLREGRARIAQKVGEEGVELALAGVKNDREEIRNETADLLYHVIVLLEDSGLKLQDICRTLIDRHAPKDTNR